MAKEPILLTAKGLEKIKEELKFLKEVKREQLSEYMGSAIADGDLRESAAYDEARLLQSANETRIADLEEIVHRAQVVESEAGDDVVSRLGASLIVEDSSGKRLTFYLVGTHEANFFENRISDESPLGKELIGKRSGDKVKFRTTEYSVIEVKFE
jgi:transcription elongation factor GreA